MHCLSHATHVSITRSYQITQSTEPNKTEPLPALPNEVWKLVFLETSYKGLQACTMVNKQWKELARDPKLSKEVIYKDFCFNPSHWNAFCGEDSVSSDEIQKALSVLPENIDQILKSPCLIFSGKKVMETHILIWIPETIKGQSVHINSLGQLLKKLPEFSKNPAGYRNIFSVTVLQEGKNCIESGWVLMTTDVLPESRSKCFADQKIMVERHDHYRVVKTAEVIACMIAEYLRSRRRLFSDAPWTFTRCQENIQEFQLNVGAFAFSGINIICYTDHEDFGVAALRKF